MTWKDFIPPILTRAISSKAFTYGRNAGLFFLKGPVYSQQANYHTLIAEGWSNSVLFACLMAVARGAGSVPWTLTQRPRSQGGKPLKVDPPHDLWTLLRRPNAWQGEAAFREALVATYHLSGNSLIARTSTERRQKEVPQELSLLMPDKANFAPIHDSLGQLIAYRHREFAPSGMTLPTRIYALPTFPAKQDTLPGNSGWTGEKIDGKLLHIRHFTPTNDWWGYSPVLSAAHSIDNFNAALAWNTALLQQYCRPSLIVSHEREIGPDDREALKEMIEESHAGPQGAGRPLLLGGGLKAQEVGLGPREMEYLKGKEDAGLDICRVMNVPPEMAGFSNSKTYANYQTARRALYTEAVFPILELIVDELNRWLLPLYDDRLVLGIDRDAIDAVREERVALFEKLNNAWWLTLNQRLALAGLPARGPEGEVLLIPNNLVPLQVGRDIALPTPTEPADPNPTVAKVLAFLAEKGYKITTNGVHHG